MNPMPHRDVRGRLDAIEDSLRRGGRLEAQEAEPLLMLSGQDAYELLATANRVARARKGFDVELCGIVNAKSGRCRENCAFCAQSAHHHTGAPEHALLTPAQMVAASREAESLQATRFGIVTSGTSLREGSDLDRVCRAVREIAREGLTRPCASLGMVNEAVLARLRDAGLTSYHHNLETARSFFPEVCTTHSYDEDVETVRATHRAGLRACSGGIFGLGESDRQRVELADTLRDLGVESVPLNFLVPIPGTPLAGRPPLEPLACLKIIAMFRLMMPDATIKVCAGRARNLKDLVSWIFFAGADGMMVGNFLTTPGRPAEADLEMIATLGFRAVGAGTCAAGGDRR